MLGSKRLTDEAGELGTWVLWVQRTQSTRRHESERCSVLGGRTAVQAARFTLGDFFHGAREVGKERCQLDP